MGVWCQEKQQLESSTSAWVKDKTTTSKRDFFSLFAVDYGAAGVKAGWLLSARQRAAGTYPWQCTASSEPLQRRVHQGRSLMDHLGSRPRKISLIQTLIFILRCVQTEDTQNKERLQGRQRTTAAPPVCLGWGNAGVLWVRLRFFVSTSTRLYMTV